MAGRMSRRDVLRAAAAGSVAAVAGGAAGAAGSTKPVRMGVIGTGGRGTHLLRLALEKGVDVPALCDIKPANLARAADLVAKARGGRKPEGYGKGETDYRRLLARDDLDAVLVATPMQWHAVMSTDAMTAGKAVLSEVAAAMTIEECFSLVRTAEKTGKCYMLAENCCYWPHVMTVGMMVRAGLFGRCTYAECGYVHDCRSLAFENDQGKLTWRGELGRDYRGNLYPTHSFGPVAQWLGINRGDRLKSVVAMSTGQESIHDYVRRRFPAGHPARKIRFKVADSTTVLIQTARGVMIDLRYDTRSSRPHPRTTYHHLQGTDGAYESRVDGIWLRSKSKSLQWEPLETHAAGFEHELWKQNKARAAKSGHGGADFFVIHEFLRCVRTGAAAPIDACDAAAWSSIIPLSAKSLAEGSRPVEVPDFTTGRWKTRKA
jgi:predicted dehydrogenase